jgi:hypothetical protein
MTVNSLRLVGWMVGSPRSIQSGGVLTDHPSTTNGQLWSTKEPTRADHADHAASGRPWPLGGESCSCIPVSDNRRR